MVFMIKVIPSKLLYPNNKIACITRKLSKYVQKDLCSRAIRQRFLDYFIKENNHKLVKSSPVVPYCDPTLAFVNAGMNQFKGIFLGNQTPKFTSVANTQKCIRVGGKHNDINIVGTDGYHHTFFEMLGNWSFGDYFKADACRMAWELLTVVYRIPMSRLYVTYFKGDPVLGIEEDLETKEIWKQLGIPETRILPFGVKENFWEMGLLGPCGTCTEIHYDHLGTSNRADFVNKGLFDLTEIWNIVFIEYNRQPDGTITKLPTHHVDTGMGFERLTSLLQAKLSNYDTDIFSYLMKAINKNCSGVPQYGGKFGEKDWNNLDQSYRILADHVRMITACLSDGVIPEQNQKLRRIMRRVFLLSESVFRKPNGLLRELSNYVVEDLGQCYSEMEKNMKQVHQIIDYEEAVYKTVRASAAKDWEVLTNENPKLLQLDIIETPSFISAYRETKSLNVHEIDHKLAFKLYDTYGVDEDGIKKISEALDIKFDPNELMKALNIAKTKSKGAAITPESKLWADLIRKGVPKTDDVFKYSYLNQNGTYNFENLDVQVLKIFHENKEVNEIDCDYFCSILLDKTNLYSEAGGQISDRGKIYFGSDMFEVSYVENLNGYILHKGFFKSKENVLKPGSKGTLKVDEDFRINCMRNHTCTHLLNAALKKVKGVTCQKSSKVTDTHLAFDVAIFGDKLTTDEIEMIEYDILKSVENNKPVNVKILNSQELLELDNITLIPGEIYPENGIRVIEVIDNNISSREPCCGTHVMNTSDIEDFCIVGVKSLGRSTTSITAVSGHRAKLAKQNGTELMDQVDSLKIYVNDNIDKPETLEVAIATLRRQLKFNIEDDGIIPYTVKTKGLEKLNIISKNIKDAVKENLRDFIEIEMKHALESNVRTTKSNHQYIVHYLRTSMMLEQVPLQQATRLCPHLPIMVISFADNTVKARCCVPKALSTEQFNAEKWLKETVAVVFNSSVQSSKGQDSSLVCNMKTKKVHLQDWDPLLKDSLEKAQKYVEENL